MIRNTLLNAATLAGGLSAALLLVPPDADAVPSFARQTGAQCAACHTVFPELTPFGRWFKLHGYTLSSGEKSSGLASLPLSALLQISNTSTKNTNTTGADPSMFPRNNQTIPQAVGVYYAGRITEKSGAFVQYSYDGIERKWGMEMADIRYADSTTVNGTELLYGATLNNTPTVQDVWNSTPVWRFPHVADAGLMPAASTVLDMTLASQVGGLGVYGLWNNLLYGEISLYRTAKTGWLRPLSTGVTVGNVVKGYAPYWRLALQRDWGAHSLEVGTYGMVAEVYPDPNNPSGPANRFRDIALDAQYQYLGGDHSFSTQATWIHEQQQWNASFPQGATANPSDKLTTLKANLHYSYQHRYGGGLGYFSTFGDTDPLKYMMEPVMGSASGSPNTRGWMAELDYLPWQNTKFALRYTAYNKFNGAATNYDGSGRNASDNNTLYLLGWFLF
ncbi:MAG: cytochrome C [Burkholderiales bacterium]